MNGSAVIPSFRYRDAHAAITWLCDVLGFLRHAVYTGPENTIAHAELTMGSGMIMLGSASNKSPHAEFIGHPEDLDGRVSSPLYVIVPDCNPVYARVQAAKVEIISELRTMEYGGQAFSVRDPEGYMWSVGEYDPWAQQPEPAEQTA